MTVPTNMVSLNLPQYAWAKCIAGIPALACKKAFDMESLSDSDHSFSSISQ